MVLQFPGVGWSAKRSETFCHSNRRGSSRCPALSIAHVRDRTVDCTTFHQRGLDDLNRDDLVEAPVYGTEYLHRYDCGARIIEHEWRVRRRRQGCSPQIPRYLLPGLATTTTTYRPHTRPTWRIDRQPVRASNLSALICGFASATTSTRIGYSQRWADVSCPDCARSTRWVAQSRGAVATASSSEPLPCPYPANSSSVAHAVAPPYDVTPASRCVPIVGSRERAALITRGQLVPHSPSPIRCCGIRIVLAVNVIATFLSLTTGRSRRCVTWRTHQHRWATGVPEGGVCAVVDVPRDLRCGSRYAAQHRVHVAALGWPGTLRVYVRR